MLSVFSSTLKLETIVHSTLPIMNKKYAEIFLCYRQLFVKGNIIIGDGKYLVQRFSFIIADFSLKVTLL